jgi:hypothetical protein
MIEQDVTKKITSASGMRQFAKTSRDLTPDYDRIVARLLMHMETTSLNDGTQVIISLKANSYTITFDDTDIILDQEWYYEKLKHLYGNEINKVAANLQKDFLPEGYVVTVFNERSAVIVLISWSDDGAAQAIKPKSSVISKIKSFISKVIP